MVVIERPMNCAMHSSRVMPSSTPVSFKSSERIWFACPSLSTSTPSLSKITRSKRLTGLGDSGDAILLEHVAVDLDAEAGPGGNVDPPLPVRDPGRGEIVAERVEGLLELEEGRNGHQAGRAVGQRGDEVQGGGEPDGRAPGVGHALHARRLGEGGDLLALREAARRADVRLDDVHGPLVEDGAERELGELVL